MTHMAMPHNPDAQGDLFPIANVQLNESAPSLLFGLPRPAVYLSAILLAMCLWNLWLTKRVIDNPPQPIVSLSLKTLLQDKMRELAARQGVSQDELGFELKLYTLALQSSVEDLQKEGKIVLVSEAVLGAPAQDTTVSMRKRAELRFEALKSAQRQFGTTITTTSGGEG